MGAPVRGQGFHVWGQSPQQGVFTNGSLDYMCKLQRWIALQKKGNKKLATSATWLPNHAERGILVFCNLGPVFINVGVLTKTHSQVQGWHLMWSYGATATVYETFCQLRAQIVLLGVFLMTRLAWWEVSPSSSLSPGLMPAGSSWSDFKSFVSYLHN